MTWVPGTRLERAIFAAPFLGAVIVVASRVSARAFRFLVAEDRVLEWTQVALFLVAALFAGRVAVWASRHGMRLLAAATRRMPPYVSSSPARRSRGANASSASRRPRRSKGQQAG